MTKSESLIKDLKKANQRLKEATEAKPTRMNKDATIQRFEFTLANKVYRKALKFPREIDSLLESLG